jgi:hypothetical protein
MLSTPVDKWITWTGAAAAAKASEQRWCRSAMSGLWQRRTVLILFLLVRDFDRYKEISNKIHTILEYTDMVAFIRWSLFRRYSK